MSNTKAVETWESEIKQRICPYFTDQLLFTVHFISHFRCSYWLILCQIHIFLLHFCNSVFFNLVGRGPHKAIHVCCMYSSITQSWMLFSRFFLSTLSYMFVRYSEFLWKYYIHSLLVSHNFLIEMMFVSTIIL